MKSEATQTKNRDGFSSGFTNAVRHLSDQLFRKLKDLIDAEDERRNSGKSIGAMSDKEFYAYVDKQMTKAERAMREADFRKQLGGKPNGKGEKADE